MSQITIKVHDQQLKTVLGNAVLAVKKIPSKVIQPEMEQARDELRTYPPERPGQRYVRTGKRYRATKVEKVGAMAYRLESNPTYSGRSANPYVLGTPQGGGQAWMHKGRWPRMVDVVTRAIKRIKKRADDLFNESFISGPGGP